MANKELYKQRAVAHRKKTRRALRELVLSVKDTPCADCGVKYPYYVMQFDHLGEKSFTIALASRKSIAIDKVRDEIARCDVVCANCHAERTHSRGQAYTVKVAPARVDVPLPDALF